MALSLEITQSDATITNKLLMPGTDQHRTQSGEKFRIVDESGNTIDGLIVTREGQNLVIEGLPESASLELSDFFEHCEDDGLACVLMMPDGQTLNAAGEAPLMFAQGSTETKTDAEDDKAAAVTVEEAAANPALETSTIALGAIGAVAIAATLGGGSGGGGSSGDSSETPPSTTAPSGALEGGDLTVSAMEATNGVTVTGTAEPNSVVVVMIGDASAQTVADANGQFSATVDGASLPADGTYPVTVTSSGPGGNSTPETTALGDVTIDTASGGNLSVTDGSASTLTGFAGSDALVGGNDVGVANGAFNTWDFTGYNSSASVANPASGLIYDPTTATSDTSIQFDTVPGNPGQPDIGWQVLADQTPGGTTPIAGIGSVGRNGFQDGITGESSNFARIEFIADSANPGNYLWETVTSEQSGGGGLSQTLNTAAGQTYSLSMDTVAPSGGFSGGHQTAGTSIEIRWGGETIAFFDATADGGVGAWVTSGGLVEPTNVDGTWTFSNLAAGSATTDLGILAYESYGPASDAFDDGVGLRIGNISVSGAAGAADQVISGGAGSDLIYGQGGNDTLYGGTASTADTATDVFVFSMQIDNGTNTIGDFDINADRIALVDVRDADATGTNVPGDTRDNTGGFGGAEGADGSASDESLTSAANINVSDLLVNGEQSIGITESNGNTVLTMTGEGGASLGTVTLTGVTGQVGADDAASLNNLIGAGLLTLTSDPYSAQLLPVA